MAAVSECAKGPLRFVSLKLLSLPHLDNLALAQPEGEWLQQEGKFLVTLN